MRVNSSWLLIPSLSRHVTVQEATVSEVRAFMMAGGESATYNLSLLTDLTHAEIEAMTAGEAHDVMVSIWDMNHEFFGDMTGRDAAFGDNLNGESDSDAERRESEALASLEQAVARMVRVGHVNAWDYPWRVFKAAVAEAEGAAGAKP
jgi:hypothetical protein